MPGRAPGPPKRQADNQWTVGSGLPLSGPPALGASGQHLTPAWLVGPWRVLFAHPGASGARRVAGTRAQRALQALYFLAFPSLTPKIPLRLSSSADSLGTVLTPLPLTPQGQHRMNSQGHTCLSFVFFPWCSPTPHTPVAGLGLHSIQFSGKAWVSPRLGPFGCRHFLVTHMSASGLSHHSQAWDQTDLTSYPRDLGMGKMLL